LIARNKKVHAALLGLVLMGSAMVMSDGLLTPAISVISAVEGLKIPFPDVGYNLIVPVSWYELYTILIYIYMLNIVGLTMYAFYLVASFFFCFSLFNNLAQIELENLLLQSFYFGCFLLPVSVYGISLPSNPASLEFIILGTPSISLYEPKEMDLPV